MSDPIALAYEIFDSICDEAENATTSGISANMRILIELCLLICFLDTPST